MTLKNPAEAVIPGLPDWPNEARRVEQGELSEPVFLPDGSAFAVASYPLPADHWLYAERKYSTNAVHPDELPAPILTREHAETVTKAIRYAIRGATNCGKEDDFDPDALVQNAVYALCGPAVPRAVPSVLEPVDFDLAELFTEEREKRMDIIGQNGNDGLHYGALPNGLTWEQAPEWARSIGKIHGSSKKVDWLIWFDDVRYRYVENGEEYEFCPRGINAFARRDVETIATREIQPQAIPVELPQALGWNQAPEWATDLGRVGSANMLIWYNAERYQYVSDPIEYTFGKSDGFGRFTPTFRWRLDEVTNVARRPNINLQKQPIKKHVCLACGGGHALHKCQGGAK